MARLGSDKKPIVVNVHRQKDAEKIIAICEMKDWAVIVGVNKDEPENIDDLVQKLEPPTLEYPGDKVGRNDYCPCQSGKKYKKCCLQNDALLA